ncbi:DedA family protein [Burkholderia pyrrocinia]|uniref:DedA family protein n=1 Tax=Burkholderia pyrrocinia TaxID=60550 RepID=UPI00201B6361|nr:VTT domain-containing protein [Burkholderia pyrrocinia]
MSFDSVAAMQCGTALHLRAVPVRAILARKAARVARLPRGSGAMNQFATLVPFGLALSLAGANSIACLIGLSLIERLIPVLPSHVLLTMIGVAGAQGAWTLPEAIVVTALGSFAGCLFHYALGNLWPDDRALALLRRVAPLGRLQPARMDALIDGIRARPTRLALWSQLVPFVRLVAPALAGLLEASFARFASGAAAGIALWNTLFITAGYLAAQAAV